MLRPDSHLGLNGLEALAALSVLLTLAWSLASWKIERIIGLALLGLVVVVSVTEATQFMTMDEADIATFLLNPADRGTQQIVLGALGSSLPFSLAGVRIMEALGASSDLIRMVIKVGWWLIGSTLCGLIAMLIIAFDQRRDDARVQRFLIVFTSLIALPTIQLAQKTFNYDLFSLGFGVAAVLLIMRGLLEARPKLLCFALAAALIAAQEKLTAGPLLISAIIALALYAGIRQSSAGSRLLVGFSVAIFGFVFSALAGLMLRAVVWTLGPPVMPPQFWQSALDATISWLWLPLRAVASLEWQLAHRPLLALVVAIGVSLSIGFASAVSPTVLRRLAGLKFSPSTARCSVVVLCIIAGAGVLGLLTVQPYWAPYFPKVALDGTFTQELNQVSLHTGAASTFRHYIDLQLYAFGSLIVPIPTALWLWAALGLIIAINMDKIHAFSYQSNKIALTLSFISLPLPIISAAFGLPFGHRYFNISIIFLCLSLLLFGLNFFAILSRNHLRPLASVALIGAIVAEGLPFSPLYAAFRPIWLNYSDSRAPEAGRINASWMGWGEEVMLAGKLLTDRCRAGDPELAGSLCSDLVLRPAFAGRWLPTRKPITVAPPEVSGITPRPNEFYVFNRLFLIQNIHPTPTIAPSFRVSMRGYDLAWIYRADRLHAAGYSLSK